VTDENDRLQNLVAALGLELRTIAVQVHETGGDFSLHRNGPGTAVLQELVRVLDSFEEITDENDYDTAVEVWRTTGRVELPAPRFGSEILLPELEVVSKDDPRHSSNLLDE